MEKVTANAIGFVFQTTVVGTAAVVYPCADIDDTQAHTPPGPVLNARGLTPATATATAVPPRSPKRVSWWKDLVESCPRARGFRSVLESFSPFCYKRRLLASPRRGSNRAFELSKLVKGKRGVFLRGLRCTLPTNRCPVPPLHLGGHDAPQQREANSPTSNGPMGRPSSKFRDPSHESR